MDYKYDQLYYTHSSILYNSGRKTSPYRVSMDTPKLNGCNHNDPAITAHDADPSIFHAPASRPELGHRSESDQRNSENVIQSFKLK